MAFCPNPDCPPRKRTGLPAEYRAGVERCADCGSLLIPEDPTEKEKPQRVVCPPALRLQIIATLGLTLALIGLAWVPLPGSLIDPAALDGLFLGLPAVGFLSLGVTPFLLGFALTELFALAIPRLRRRRLKDLALRRKLWRAALIASVFLAFVQGLGTALSLENMGLSYGAGGYLPPMVPDPGMGFRLSCAILLTAGSAVFAAFAFAVDKIGLGRGFAVAIVASMLMSLPGEAAATIHQMNVGVISPFMIILVAACGLGMLLGLGWLWRWGQASIAPLPIRLPTCGLFPLDLALSLGALPSILAYFFWTGWIEFLNQELVPGSNAYLALELCLVALFVAPMSILFHFRRRKFLRSPAQARSWRKAQIFSGLFLAGVVLLDQLIARQALNLWPGTLTLVALYALGGDWLAEFSARRQTDLKVLETHQDLSDAIASLAVYRQMQPELTFVLTGERYRALTYIFAPYAPLTLLGPPEAKPRAIFSGGEIIDEATLAAHFE